MTNFKKVTGTWHGTYSYDPLEHIPKLDPIPFTLILKQGWFGRFTGKVSDGPGGMPDTGAIKGRFSFPRIAFTKQMPVFYVVMPDRRNISLRQFLLELGETCEHEIPHPPIFYTGEFSDDRHAKGTWIIRAEEHPLSDGRAVPLFEASGVWRIEKIG